MSWNHIKTLSLPGPVSEMATSKDSWLLRGLDYVAEVDPNKIEVSWVNTIAGDYSFSYQGIVICGGVGIFVSHRNEEPNEVWLQAFTCQTGEPLWERQINWRAFENLGGLLVDKQGLILMEYTKQAPRLLLISPLTGQIISQTKATIVEGAGTTRDASESAAYVANKAYFYHPDQGVYAFSPLAKKQDFKLFLKSNKVRGLAGSGENLYYHEHPFDLFWLDGATGQQKGKLTLPAYPRKIIAPAEDPGNLLVLFKRKRGLAVADFRQGKCRWHVGEKEKWNVSYAVWTPAGIIASINKRGGYFVSLDQATGKQKLAPPEPLCHSMSFFHWTGKYFMVGTSQGFEYRLEVFRPS